MKKENKTKLIAVRLNEYEERMLEKLVKRVSKGAETTRGAQSKLVRIALQNLFVRAEKKRARRV